MTTFAAPPDTERRLAEIEASIRGAWSSYRNELRDLDGRAYDDAELPAWDQLQATLRQLASERAALAPTTPTG